MRNIENSEQEKIQGASVDQIDEVDKTEKSSKFEAWAQKIERDEWDEMLREAAEQEYKYHRGLHE